jgi:hypothetical protein
MSAAPARRSVGSAVPRPVEGLRTAVIDDGIILLDRRTARCHVLNPTASAVWDCIDRARTVDEIIAMLGVDSDATHDVIVDAVDRAIARFVELDVVAWSDPEPLESAEVGPSDSWWTANEARRTRWGAYLDRRIPTIEGTAPIGTYRFLDVVVSIGTNDPGISLDVTELLGPMADPTAEPNASVWILDRSMTGHGRFRVHIDGLHRGGFPSEFLAIDFVLRELNARAVVATRDVHLMHAGAVERGGRVMVIPGVSGNGKSTLTAALVAAGFSYLTDELVAIEPATGFVRPYPKPLDLDRNSLDLLGFDPDESGSLDKLPVSPSRVGSVSDGGPLSMLVVLQPAREGSIEQIEQIEQLEPLDALEALLPNVFGETYERDAAFQELVDLCGRVPVLVVPRLPIDETVDAIIERFGRWTTETES